MKIALLHPTYWPEVRRGSERVVHDLGVALSGQGHGVEVLTSHASLPASAVEEGVEVRRAWRPPAIPWLREHEYHLGNVPAQVTRLLAGGFDVAHAFFPSDAWAACLARRRGGPPVVFASHGIPTREYLVARRFRLELVTATVAKAAACTVLSEAAAKPFRRYLLHDPVVLPPGVFCDDFAVDLPRAPLPTLICAASLGDPRKRGQLLLSAFSALRDRVPEARLLVVRTRDPFMSPEGLPELPAGAEWVDVGGAEALAAAYASAWASVTAAVEEAFGLVLVESLAAGTPVVAARSGAAPEIIDDERIGRLFTADDERGLTLAMDSVLELSDAEVRGPCRDRAAEYDWSRLIGSYEQLYDSVVEGSAVC